MIIHLKQITYNKEIT